MPEPKKATEPPQEEAEKLTITRHSNLLDPNFTGFRNRFETEIEKEQEQMKTMYTKLLDKNGNNLVANMFAPEPSKKEKKKAEAEKARLEAEEAKSKLKFDPAMPNCPNSICTALLSWDQECTDPPPPPEKPLKPAIKK